MATSSCSQLITTNRQLLLSTFPFLENRLQNRHRDGQTYRYTVHKTDGRKTGRTEGRTDGLREEWTNRHITGIQCRQTDIAHAHVIDNLLS